MVHTTRTTNPAGYGQPVRFYKAVAITFLVLTLGLLGMIAFMSAKRVEITIVTKTEPVDVSFPVEIGTAADGAISGSVSSTIISFEQSFTPRTTTTTASGPASVGGTVTLINDSDSEQPLVATTRLITANNVLYRLSKATTVPAKGTSIVEVYADKKEAANNLASPTQFTIPGLSEARQKEVYAKSIGKLTATGERQVGIVTAEDISSALSAYNDALKEKAKTLAQAKFPGSGATGYIAQSMPEASAKIGDTVDSFKVTGKATVVLANFKIEDVATSATAMLNRKIVDNNDVLESALAQPSVTFESFDATKNVLTLRVSQTGTVNLDQNSAKLQKQVFFGKSEEEVRRYVMSIDHVESVDMKFRPLWNKTVPQVADHVKIIIKQVE